MGWQASCALLQQDRPAAASAGSALAKACATQVVRFPFKFTLTWGLAWAATQAASQASGESGGNTNLPSWSHLTQLAQVISPLLFVELGLELTHLISHFSPLQQPLTCMSGNHTRRAEAPLHVTGHPSEFAYVLSAMSFTLGRQTLKISGTGRVANRHVVRFHLQALQQQGGRPGGNAPSPLGFMQPAANNS